MIKVMLSLDLKNAQDSQRDDFNAHLEENDWLKLKRVDTVWFKRYSGVIDNTEGFDSVRNNLARTIKAAAAAAKLQKVTYVAQLGNRDAIGRVVSKVSEGYAIANYNPYPE